MTDDLIDFKNNEIKKRKSNLVQAFKDAKKYNEERSKSNTERYSKLKNYIDSKKLHAIQKIPLTRAIMKGEVTTEKDVDKFLNIKSEPREEWFNDSSKIKLINKIEKLINEINKTI